MLDDRVQNLNSVTCGIFEIYFYDNLFKREKNSKIKDKKRLNRRTIETLLNELFVLDDQETTSFFKTECTFSQTFNDLR